MTLTEAMELIQQMEPPVQREAIRCLRANEEDAVALLLERLNHSLEQALMDYEDGADDTRGAYWYPMYLLAEFRAHEAFEPLAALLEHDEEYTDWLLGEAVTEDFACILASCAQPDNFIRLRELVFDNGYKRLMNRLAALEAACILYACGEVSHCDILQLLREALAQATKQKDRKMAAFIACSAVDIGMFEMKDEIRLLFEQGKVEQQIVGNWKMFARESRFEQTPASTLRKYKQDLYHRKIDNAISVIESWPGFKPTTKAPDNVLAVPQKAKEKQTYSGFASKAAPNDPCACGSGKKYKKCCMEY
ncbi:MAG: DUF1186 domain-containing protein [Firmicutes bacterium]|nr:DUF1186 domain-containing protein [Bacillota bacterium]